MLEEVNQAIAAMEAGESTAFLDTHIGNVVGALGGQMWVIWDINLPPTYKAMYLHLLWVRFQLNQTEAR